MYLSEPRKASTLVRQHRVTSILTFKGDHDQVENLLETYSNTLEQMCNETNRLLTTIRLTCLRCYLAETHSQGLRGGYVDHPGHSSQSHHHVESVCCRRRLRNQCQHNGHRHLWYVQYSHPHLMVQGMNLDIPDSIMHANIWGMNAFSVRIGLPRSSDRAVSRLH